MKVGKFEVSHADPRTCHPVWVKIKCSDGAEIRLLRVQDLRDLRYALKAVLREIGDTDDNQ